MRKLLTLLILLSLNQPAFAGRRSRKIIQNVEREAEAALATVPKDNEACFAPDEPCSAKLVKFIASAKTSVEIAIFEMTDRKVAEAIAEAAQRVKVRLVVNRKLVKDTGPAFDLVRASPAQIRVGKQKGIMHDKFTIVDGKRLETGSYNYSYAAGNSNQENQLYLSTPSVVERYESRFEKMWREAKH